MLHFILHSNMCDRAWVRFKYWAQTQTRILVFPFSWSLQFNWGLIDELLGRLNRLKNWFVHQRFRGATFYFKVQLNLSSIDGLFLLVCFQDYIQAFSKFQTQFDQLATLNMSHRNLKLYEIFPKLKDILFTALKNQCVDHPK